MPRTGHKEGCKCSVCRGIDTKPRKEEIVETVVETVVETIVGPTLGSVPIGQNFRYNGRVYKKINDAVVQNFLNGDDTTESMPNNTVIDPIIPSHEVEPDA